MMNQNVKVYCRIRGLSEADLYRGAADIVEIDGQQVKTQGETFDFQQVVKGEQLQMNLEVKEADQWFFSYGGCATGKSSALFGENGVVYQICGMYINHFKDKKITMSMIEVKDPKLLDLFGDKEVKLQESNQSFACNNLTSINVESLDQFCQVVRAGRAKSYSPQSVMNINCTLFPLILKIDFGNFSLQFCDMVGYEKPNLAGKQQIKQISTNNNALSLIERIADTKNEKERLLLCNSALLTKVLKNSFRNTSQLIWILCISSANHQIKDTLRTLNIIKH